MAQRTQACTACHGKQGRAGPDGYYPRLAGKPAAYLYNQLLNFRDGKRHYGLMTGLIAPLSDTYLMEMAQYFSSIDTPYPAPPAATAPNSVLERGRALVTRGDAGKKVPACTQCHGQALTGTLPNIPGLLGLPRDYINAQLGGWQTGQRRAHTPDCMATIAKQLTGQDVSAIAHWLASQPVPRDSRPQAVMPLATLDSPRPDCGRAPPPVSERNATSQPGTTSALAGQGEYLARAGNCMTCHTARGGTPYAGGHGIDTPFGTVFSSNITSSASHGLGNWTPAEFWQAMHHGRSRDGRLLNPAFPYSSFTLMTRADSDALLAYLKTRPASAEPNRPHDMRWPFGTQTALAVWRQLYFRPGVYTKDDTRSDEWNRGAYLVQGAGHCGACHTPRNALGASRHQQALSGSMMPAQNWYAPSLLSLPEAGTGKINSEHTLELLGTGVSPSSSAIGPMADVVRHSTQHLLPGDLQAMTVYLQSVSDPATPLRTTRTRTRQNQDDDANAQSRGLQAGSKLYETNCAQCHGKQGEGQRGAYPALSGNRAVMLHNPTNLVQIVLYGGYAPATQGNPRPFGMPPFVLQLSNKDTADILTFIRSNWGNTAPAVTELEVNQARDVRRR